MSFFERVGSIATMTLGIAALAGTAAPGFAAQAGIVDRLPPTMAMATDRGDGDAVVAKAQTRDARPLPETGDFDSLSQAVAAQDLPTVRSDDLICLAGAIYFEAKGEPLAGQLAVAEVVLNRSKSGRFAPSVCGVVTQAGQFSFVRGGRVPAIGDNASYRIALAVAQVALGDQWDSSASDALYFHARRVAPGWRMQKIASIGNHIFYR